MDPQHFGSLDPDPDKYADSRNRFQGAKYQPKLANKISFALKTQIAIVS